MPTLVLPATGPDQLQPADRPTILFVGVTTGRSSIMSVFPRWAEHLCLGDVAIRGVDCKLHDDPANYRRVVEHIRRDPLTRGALVTTHKIDLLHACRDLFDDLDRYATLTGEVSSISKREGKLIGHAKDPITSGLALEAFLPADHWRQTGGEVLLLGAGGSSLALTVYLAQQPQARRPSRIVVTNRSGRRLEEMQHVHAQMGSTLTMEYHLAPQAGDNDRALARMPAHSLVVNATGLGKDAPGSPLTDAALFPAHAWAWDFNYRGDLLFLEQARRQQEARSLHVHDGWVYFLHGWTRVIAEVFDVEIPVAGPVFVTIWDLARQAR
jgi:shikimate 5-dehydrogenase